MRTLHHKHNDQGFAVLGFPCNQFGAQEPGTEAEILEFVQSNYDVDFPMFAKIDVNGDQTCDLYNLLKDAQSDDEGNRDIAWNFTKFLVDKSGNVVARFDPRTTPEEIDEQLAQWL